MASQEQKIEDSSLENSQIQQAQAEGDLVAVQGTNNKVTINNIFVRLFGKLEPPRVDWDWVQKKLNQHSSDICNRLKATLGDDRTLMDVTAQEQTSWVNRSLQAERTLEVDGQDYGSLDPNTPLIETFNRDYVAGQLLILGAPGAGKTTALLSLAKQLVREALEKPKTVIPILFELSTWRDDNQSIHDWLIEQLYDLYPSQRKYKRYETWLEQQVLLPLMDGLDELGLERQKKCTIKLKEFARGYPHLVICCRDRAFEAVKILNPLRGKVYLKPLADKQIQDYLERKNRSELWAEIEAKPDLSKLLEPTPEGDPGLFRVPLFLKLATDVYDPQKPILNKSDLLEKYIDQQLCPKKREQDRHQDLERRKWTYKTVEEEPGCRQVRRTLGWVAQQLNTNHSVELLIEQIQPSWLMSDHQQRLYWLFCTLVLGLIIGLLLGAMFTLIFGWTYKVTSILIFGIIYGFVFGSFGEMDQIITVESLKFPKSFFEVKEIFQTLRKAIMIWLAAGLGVFLIRGLHIILIIWLFYGLIFISINFFKKDIDKRKHTKFNQGIKSTLENMIILAIISVVYAILLEYFLLRLCPSSSFTKISIIVFFAIIGSTFYIGGGKAILQHNVLRFVLALYGYVPYRFEKFLKYCDERKLLYPVGGRYRFLHRELLDHFDPSKR